MAQVKSSTASLVHLSKSDVKRMLKPRAGFEAYVAQLVELATAQPALQSKSFDAKAILDELRAYQTMQGVVAEAKKQLALARETRLQHASNVWRAMLRIYEHAQAEAKDDADVQYAIAGFEAFMKNGRKPHVSPPATTGAPVATTTPATAA